MNVFKNHVYDTALEKQALHWNPIVVRMPTSSSLEAPEVVVMTTSGVASEKVGIMPTLGFQWESYYGRRWPWAWGKLSPGHQQLQCGPTPNHTSRSFHYYVKKSRGFLGIQLIVKHHWFSWCLGTKEATSHYLNQWSLTHWSWFELMKNTS